MDRAKSRWLESIAMPTKVSRNLQYIVNYASQADEFVAPFASQYVVHRPMSPAGSRTSISTIKSWETANESSSSCKSLSDTAQKLHCWLGNSIVERLAKDRDEVVERPGRHTCCLTTGHRRVLAVYHDLKNAIGLNETALRKRATSSSLRHRVSTNSWHSFSGIAAYSPGPERG